MTVLSDVDPDQLVRDHLPLVQQVVAALASRYPRHVDREELAGAGALGLVEAARRYDPTTGIPFERFAAIRIRGAVIDSTRNRDWATRGVRSRARAIDVAAEELGRRNGRTPTTEEVAAELAIAPAEVETRRAAVQAATLLHLDAQIGCDEEPLSLGERVEESDERLLPDAAIAQRELLGTLRVAIATLPELTRRVLTRYYFGGELLRDIADDLGVTEARASQIRAEALNAMRAWFSTSHDGVVAVPTSAPGRRSRTTYVQEMGSTANWRRCLEAADQPVAVGA